MAFDVEALIHSMVGLLVSIIVCLMIISLSRQFYCVQAGGKKKKSKYYPSIRHSSVICLLAYWIRLFTIFLMHIPFYCPECGISHSTAISWQIISALFLFLSKPLTQLHFISRLFYTFKSSAFESSRATFAFLLCIIVIQILCILSYFISGLVQKKDHQNQEPLLVEDDFEDGNYGKPVESALSIALLAAAVFNDLLVSFILTYLFVSKLFKLLILSIKNRDDVHSPKLELLAKPPATQNRYKLSMESESDSNREAEIEASLNDAELNESLKSQYSKKSSAARSYTLMAQHSVELKPADTKMVDTITRYTLLGAITMIFTQFYFGIELVHIVWISLYKEGDKVSYHSLDVLLAALSVTDSLIAICSIYLNFVFSRRWYNRLCYFPHRGLQSICTKLTQRRVLKEHRFVSAEYQLMT